MSSCILAKYCGRVGECSWFLFEMVSLSLCQRLVMIGKITHVFSQSLLTDIEKAP
jgi:hypothetical protein